MKKECVLCARERRARGRVMDETDIAALSAQELEDVPCAVPNNDMRYEINKNRACLYAAQHEYQLLWCPARDKVRVDVLREDPSLPLKKQDWLRRHDRQCGDLLGMLPLVQNMKMVLTEHIDKDERYQMLKGAEVFAIASNSMRKMSGARARI